MMSYSIGLEEDLSEVLTGSDFCLLANAASVDMDMNYSWEVLKYLFPGDLKFLIAPQHGLYFEQQANMVESPDFFDENLGLEVRSLYSDIRKPSREMLDGIDTIVIDLQDVGVRIYTYIWTLFYCLEAAAECGKRVVILDRPNPIAHFVEGPMLNDSYRSFVGLWNIPLHHNLTLGELALLFRREKKLDVELEIVPMRGWSRNAGFADRRWLPTSPNMPTKGTLLLYPGFVLFEGINISEGRGTTTPFEVVGAPFVNCHILVEYIESHFGMDEFALLPTSFIPTFDKFCGEVCNGVRIIPVMNRASSVKMAVQVMYAISRLWGIEFLPPPYEYEYTKMPIDILFGSDTLRTSLEAFKNGKLDEADKIEEILAIDVTDWNNRITDIMLYR